VKKAPAARSNRISNAYGKMAQTGPACTPIVGSIDNGDPTQTDRLFRSGIPQTARFLWHRRYKL